ncbi:MAG TPA: diguanylate cyclase, partial [Dehalococcoidia bacterium]|nr:diguanylate cyclase [Dehalococcoidia bacterium]
RMIYANDAAARLFGFGSAASLPRGKDADPWRDFELTDDGGLPVLRESLPDRRAANGKQADETLVCARPRDGGEGRWLLLKSTAIRDEDERMQFAVNVITDVTERRRAEQLERQALTDSLTGLPNRRLVDDRLQQAIFVAQRNRGSLALLFIDLNRFKTVNDTYGHAAGDQLLQEVSGRLQESLRQTDTVARLGGDEFTAILPGARPPGAAAAAEKILTSLDRPFIIGGQLLSVGASIGIAFYPDDADDAATLTRHADLAMYAAKRGGRGHAIYSPEMDGGALALPEPPRISA